MKKALLVFGAATLASAGLNAQTFGNQPTKAGFQKLTLPKGEAVSAPVAPLAGNRATYWQNDFSNAATWETGTAAAQGNFQIGTNANIGQLGQYMGNMQSTTNANGFAFFNGVQYLLNNTAAAQDCWIEADSIDLTGATVITVQFEQRYRAFNIDQTFVELSTDDGATWTSVEVNADQATNAPATTITQNINLDVTGAGANCVLRFHWKAPLNSGGSQFSSGYGWMVDDVKIVDAPVNNMVLTQIFKGEYTKYPLGQEERPITFWGKVLNDGSAQQTGVTLEVTANGTSVGTSNSVTVAPFATDSLALTADYTPSGLGVKSLEFEVSQAATDEVPADNTQTATIEVTQNTFSRDNNVYAGNGFGSYTFGGIEVSGVGSVYELIEPASATSVSFVLDMDSEAGSTVQAVILRPEGTELVEVAQSDFYELQASDIPTAAGTNPVAVRLTFFDTPVALDAGEYLIGIKHEGGGVSIAYVPGTNTDDVLIYLDDSGFDWFGAQGGIEEAMIRLNLNEGGVGINENVASTSVDVFPNPTSDVLNVTMRDFSGNTDIKMVNMNGQVVYNTQVNVNAATFVKTIDVSSLAAGLYTITLSSETGVSTLKVAVK